jgi:hypothetical protein
VFPTTAVYMSQTRIDSDPGAAQYLATALVKTLAYIRGHSPEEIAALIPPQIAGDDRAAYVQALGESIAMYRNDGRMPADAAEAELRVLQAAIPRYAKLRAESTYSNEFVDHAGSGRRPLAGSPWLAAQQHQSPSRLHVRFEPKYCEPTAQFPDAWRVTCARASFRLAFQYAPPAH